MHFLFFVAVIVLCWLVYSLLRTQKRMETELREIRKRCVGGTLAQADAPAPLTTTEMLKVSGEKISDGIQRLMELTT